MSPHEYAEDFCAKSISFGTVYYEDRLKFIFIEGLHGHIIQIISGYWSKNFEDDLKYLTREAKSMANIHGNQHQTSFNADKNHR